MLNIESLTTPDFIDIIRNQSVSLFYLFGSQASSTTSPLSDVDCAVLFAPDVPAETYSDRQIRLIAEISRRLRRDDIDLVVLNAANPVVRFNVLAGELLYMKSDEERIDFEVKTRREYFDTQRIRDIRARALIDRQLRTG